MFNVDGNVIGNNKWTWNGSKFVTDGTTAVGSWLFYAQYNKAVTGSRQGVTFKFPQIQDGAADLSMAANNNINFHISPVVKIDGYEGESVNIPVKYASVYNYLNLKLAFKADVGVTNAEKIVVKAQKTAGTDYIFPAQSRVKLDSDYPVAKLALINTSSTAKVDDLDGVTGLTSADQEIAAMTAYAAMSDITLTYNATEKKWNDPDYNWEPSTSKAGSITEAVGTDGWDKLVVDCDPAHTTLNVVDNKFSTYMLMPAGVYASITLEIYTNKGVYTKTVDGMDYYKENRPSTSTDKTPASNGIVLKPQASQSLADVKKEAKTTDSDYLTVTGTPTAGNLIVQTSDLISFINALPATAGTVPVNVISQNEISGNGDAAIAAHKAVINADVMQALANKQAAVTGNGEVVLKFNNTIDIVGNTEGQLVLKNLRLADANIVSGNVKIDTNVIAGNQVITVKAGTLEVSQAAEIADVITVAAGATVNVTGNAYFATVNNSGSFNVNNAAAIENEWDRVWVEKLNNNAGKVTVAQGAVVKFDMFYNGTHGTKTTYGAKLANSGTITVISELYSVNSTISNNGIMNIQGQFVQNYDSSYTGATPAATTNGAAGVIEVNAITGSASYNILEGTTLVNKGILQVLSSDATNTINNLGTITVNKGARTLISTNAAGTKRGTIILAERAPKNFKVSIGGEQGYIQYTIAAGGTFTPNSKDVFNKVVFMEDVNFKAVENMNYIKYIVANGDVDFSEVHSTKFSSDIRELTFAADAAIYTPVDGITTKYLIINEDVELSLPTNNKLTVSTGITNNGEMVVSGTEVLKNNVTGTGKIVNGGGNITWN